MALIGGEQGGAAFGGDEVLHAFVVVPAGDAQHFGNRQVVQDRVQQGGNILHQHVDNLVYQLAVFNFGGGVLDPLGLLAVVLAAQVALIDVVHIVQQGLVAGDHDARQALHNGGHGAVQLGGVFQQGVHLIQEHVQSLLQAGVGNEDLQFQGGTSGVDDHAALVAVIIQGAALFRGGQQQGQAHVYQLVYGEVHACQVGNQALDDRADAAGLDGLGIVAVEEAVDGGGEHIVAEAVLTAVFRHVLNGALLAGEGVGEGDGAQMGLGLHLHILGDGTVLIAAGQGDKAHGRGIGDHGAGLNVIEGVAGLGGDGGDVIGVHVAGEDILHPGVGIHLAQALIVVDQVHGQQVGLHGEVGHHAVVLEADYRIAPLFGGGDLLYHPLLQVGADGAAGLVLVQAAVGVVGAVAGGINGNNGVAVLGPGRIGEAAGFFPLGGRIAGNDAVVIVYGVAVNLHEILGLRAAGGLRLAAFGVEVHGVGIAHIVVAGNHIHIQAGDFFFQRFQLGGQGLVAFLLAVLGQVAGNQQHIGLVLFDGVQHPFQDSGAFREHLPVAVQMVGVVRRVLNHVRGKVVGVREDGDLQLVRFLAGDARCKGRQAGAAQYRCG